jgi:FkbM family methyltransferase
MYVWDIGANVATASIYFASVQGWDVSAYELFPKTAEVARENIDRSGLSDRIKLNAFGLGAITEELTLMYSDRSKGGNGFFTNFSPNLSDDEVPMDVKVVDAAEEIQQVRKLANQRPILAKIDCEGAEYKILPRLAETDNLRFITAIVMEEHKVVGHDREALVTLIRDAGFIVRRTRRMDDTVSMLFACRVGG